MDAFLRNTVLVTCIWLMLAGVCLGKQVYLKDGGIIESQSAWQRGDTVYVKVNRDIIADFDQSEIDLRRTFPKTGTAPRHVHRKVAVTAAAAAVETKPVPASVAPVAPAAAVAKPAPQPGAPPAPATAPVEKNSVQPEAAQPTSSDPSSPPDKAEMERRSKQAADMMAEALMKKDPELMKKAIEMQKSALPQQGAASQKNAGIPIFVPLIVLAVCLLIIVAQWVIFERAGRAGWKCLIPFYNMYVLMEIAGKPGWWMFLMLVPVVNIVFFLLAMLSLAKKFGRSELLGVGITILPMIFLPVLAFGGSQYEG